MALFKPAALFRAGVIELLERDALESKTACIISPTLASSASMLLPRYSFTSSNNFLVFRHLIDRKSQWHVCAAAQTGAG